jgi:tetratricopeptide (TPR) repeat protein
LWICREQTAKHPFRVEGFGLELYTIEELCYFLYENITALEDGVMGETLFTWLREELEMPRLAESLGEYYRKGSNPVWCAWFLLQETGMYRTSELEEIGRLAREMEHQDEFWCKKKVADQLVRIGKYGRGILEYEKLLRREDAREQKEQMLGSIWHNLGVAKAGLFLFQEAAEAFEKAYQLNQDPASRLSWEEACAMTGPRELPVEETHTWEEWEEILLSLRGEYKKKVM